MNEFYEALYKELENFKNPKNVYLPFVIYTKICNDLGFTSIDPQIRTLHGLTVFRTNDEFISFGE